VAPDAAAASWSFVTPLLFVVEPLDVLDPPELGDVLLELKPATVVSSDVTRAPMPASAADTVL
jgi:hypothetical protein